MATARSSVAVMLCPSSDPKCTEKVGTHKPGAPGLQNYPAELLMLSSETLSTPEGLRFSLRIVLRNPTGHDFGPFKVVVSPATILQGQPVGPPPIFLVEIESLAAGETTMRYVNSEALPPFEGGRFGCFDPDFVPIGG